MYHKTMLENGIRIVTEKTPHLRSIAMGILIDAGPRNEVPGQSGLAHLTEHLMFEGTKNRDAMQIARMMDEAGGQMGGFTTRDYTGYTATILDDYLPYAVELMGDILLNSTFSEDKVEREKRIVLREISANRDMPDQQSEDLLKAFIWSDHPLGRPIAGNADTIRHLTREDIIQFVQRCYSPDRMIVSAAGNISHADFTAQIQDAFWQMSVVPSGSTPSLDNPSQRCCWRSGVVVEHIPVSQTYFSIGLRAFPYAHPDRYGLHLFNSILGGGISSRLFRRIREEQGLVYEIDSDYHAYRDDGILIIKGSTTPEYLMTVLELILMELKKLIFGKEPADAEELWKAKMHIKAQHLIASENTHTLMSRLSTQEFYFGREISTDEILSNIESVDTHTFQILADKGLKDSFEQIAVAVVGPESQSDYTLSSIEHMLTQVKGEK